MNRPIIRRTLGWLCGGIAASVVALTCSTPAMAAPGALDPTFGTGGEVTTQIGDGRYALGHAVAVQSDGKVVVAGIASQGANEDFALARYTASGSLDATFGSGGIVTTAVQSSDISEVEALAIQGDGKIIAAGGVNVSCGTGCTSSEFGLARYNANGTLDTTFGTNGSVVFGLGDAPTCAGGANDVAIQPDGKIVLAGDAADGGGCARGYFAVDRLNANGTQDTAFGTGGHVLTPIGASGGTSTNGVVLQPDGKIVVVGDAAFPGGTEFALARYTALGVLDTTFGAGGEVLSQIGTSGSSADAVALQPDGKLVVSGFADDPTNQVFALARYTASGSLDSGFGSAGQVLTPIGSEGSPEAHAVALASDGSIVAAGATGDIASGASSLGLVRYTPSGALDSSFGSGGKVVVSAASGIAEARAVALQGDGKIVTEGIVGTPDAMLPGQVDSPRFFVARFATAATPPPPPPPHTLRVTRSGTGTGSVTSTPGGISCGATCSHSYASGTQVTLTAHAASGSHFGGWSGGGCHGTGTCRVTLTSDGTVTATFTRAGATGAGAPNTKITRVKIDKRKRTAKISFKGSGGTGKLHFKCRLDRGRFSSCRSPISLKHLKKGRHTFAVEAIDSRGKVDRTPARATFAI